jgi:cell division protein FtsB
MLLAEQYSNSAQLRENRDFPQDSPVQSRPAKKRFQNRVIFKILVCTFCLVLANIIFQALVIKRTQEIKVWQGKLAKLERVSVKLRIEMANLESFDRIQTAAQKDLGMRVAGPEDYMCIAAAPEPPRAPSQNPPQSYGTYQTGSTPPENLWNRLAGWIEGIGETMAQPATQ